MLGWDPQWLDGLQEFVDWICIYYLYYLLFDALIFLSILLYIFVFCCCCYVICLIVTFFFLQFEKQTFLRNSFEHIFNAKQFRFVKKAISDIFSVCCCWTDADFVRYWFLFNLVWCSNGRIYNSMSLINKHLTYVRHIFPLPSILNTSVIFQKLRLEFFVFVCIKVL